jgi:hypothetical protein
MTLNINKTMAYALRRLAGCITKRCARQLAGSQNVDMVVVKSEIMEMADSVEGKGRRMKVVLPVSLRDLSGAGDPVSGTIVNDWGGLLLHLDGFGHKNTEPGAGYVVALEQIEGQVMLYAWTDINREEPTVKVDLTLARESNRLEEVADGRQG